MIHSGKTDCNPDDVGYNAKALESLDKHFQTLIDKGMIKAAAYLLSRNGKVFAHRSMGRQSAYEDKGEFLPDSIRPIASITKVFTTTALLQLMERGKFFLQQPVSDFIKEFDTDMHRNITIFQLLTHTSGLKADPGNFFEPYPTDWEGKGWTKKNWIKKILTGPLQFKPGTVWNYCSRNFEILAELIARLSGMDYDTYIEKYIFKPLGMDSSFFFIPDNVKDKVCIISKYNSERVNQTREQILTPSLLGGGEILSTLFDLWKLAQMMLNGGTFNGKRILGRKTVEAAVKPQVKNITAYNWRPHIFDDSYKWTCGLGWELNKHCFLSDGTYDHEGSEGAGLFIDPTENFIFVGFYPDPDYSGEAWINSLAIAWSGIK
jgi:CubicO group peptidase (beta-lactamase class C family)